MSTSDKSDQLERETLRRDAVESGLKAELVVQGQRLVESDALFRLLIENVRDYAIFMLDASGRVATWNAGAERFKGYTAREIIGHHFSAFYPDTDVRAGKCEHELEIAARVGRFEEEGWRVRKDGTQFWANVVISSVRDASGELIGFAKVTRDLTERKLAEQHRRATEERFSILLESIRDYAIFILDPNGNVATWNTGAERIKGYRAEEIIGSHFSRFYPEEDVRAGKCELELEVAARDGRFEDEGWRIRKDGSRFWANVVISAAHDGEGRLVGFSKVTRDLTDRRRNEDERMARLAAEEANRAKDEFLAMLGHELRNPLAPIVSAVQLMKLRGDGKSIREQQIIERQVAQMTRLVDDLLDVSRITRGKITLKRERCDVRDVLARAAEIALPLFERNDQHFNVSVPPQPSMVDGDDARLVQVFANLLNNASKYTQQGGHVQLTVTHVDEEVVIEIRDDGIGMDAALLPRVFELFVQGYQEADRAAGGLGIGLTLVRSLVELHGGRVQATSAGRGLGSKFTVTLPAIAEATATEPARGRVITPLRLATAPLRILVVDDNDDARTLLSDMLETLGHEVQSAADGPSALALLRNVRTDVAILDIGLPGMSGHELATKIRALPGGAQVRLIAITGYGQAKDKADSALAGFDVHLTKPVGINQLLTEIARDRRPADDAS